MADTPDWPEDNAARPRGTGIRTAFLTVLIVAATVVFGLYCAWSFSQISELRAEVSELRASVASARQNSVLLTEIVNSGQEALVERLSSKSEELQDRIVRSASAKLNHSIDVAMGRLSAFGNAGFAFQMAEFDRRSCVNGGVFSGELPDGNQHDEPFEAGNLIEVQPTHGDVRGIPFYRVKIAGKTMRSQDGRAQFRHGSMRIECN
ncbi:hypothetical protein [Hoeflea sp. TYP-13]|uniref:hypothetical protein n=1 Tax=Hoeflea sp. TYP-13 TaxID=3230023 RepID=UPI0034C662D4